MTAIENVTGTAFIVAEFRAEEATESKPLYRDTIVPVFLNEDTKRAAARIADAIPAVKKMVRIRTRYLDDRLDARLQEGCTQVVILGAGLDTRAIRKQAPEVAYFEIDDETTLSYKKARLAEKGLTANVSFLYGNYVTDDFIHLLISKGFDRSRPTHVIWEGNTMYLTAASVRQVMADMARHVRQFTLSFDYFKEAVINEATGDDAATLIAQRFAAMGAPWRTGIDDLQRLAEDAAMRLVDNVATAELHRAYWPGQAMDLAIFDYYFLCTLRSPAR